MKRLAMAIAALTALAGCDRIGAAVGAAPANSEPAADAAAAAGEADSEWIEMNGVWAPAGACGDVTKEWRLEPQSFHLHEMHCRIEQLDLIEGGVRAVAQCAVEGDDDQIPDEFRFIRRADASLSIVNDANEAATDGLVACAGDMIP